MKERPILFSGPMVRAILAGRKTQTRRVVKLPADYVVDEVWDPAREGESMNWPVWSNHHLRQGDEGFDEPGERLLNCPYGQPGDRLWVRETVCLAPKRFATPDESCIPDVDGDLRYVSYKADGHCEEAMRDYKLKWRPSIHMPRWASRIDLEVVSVRVERLQEISEADAIAEGVERHACGELAAHYLKSAKGEDWPAEVLQYAELWQEINGAGSWAANPWVWVVGFKRVTKEATP